MTKHWEKRMYRTTLRVLSKPPSQRPEHEASQLEPFFRRKSKLLASLAQDTLVDVIKNCQFVTRDVNDCIIHQGEKGHRFYIILRGKVSILHKDSLEDVDLGEEGEPRPPIDRTTLGNFLVSLVEGQTFGEIALINPDCIRTASVVADEPTDLVVIDRALYNRSVSQVIAREYADKMAFIDSIPLFNDWAMKWKKHLATSFRKETFSFDVPLFKQGEPATDMYFIVSGEVKLLVEPEAHHQQFERFLAKSGPVHSSASTPDSSYFPIKLIPQIEKFSRVCKANARSHGLHGEGDMHCPTSWSPSSIRKMNLQRKAAFNLCFLGEKQHVGAVEFVLGLDVYHDSAVCSQETVVYCLHRPHFDRLFKRRNPRSVKSLANTLELQLSQRLASPNIMESAPLLQAFLTNIKQKYSPPTARHPTPDTGLITPRLRAQRALRSAKT